MIRFPSGGLFFSRYRFLRPETDPINIVSIGTRCVGKNNQRQHYVVLFRVDLYSVLDVTLSTCVKKSVFRMVTSRPDDRIEEEGR